MDIINDNPDITYIAWARTIQPSQDNMFEKIFITVIDLPFGTEYCETFDKLIDPLLEDGFYTERYFNRNKTKNFLSLGRKYLVR